jgi:serine/threonine protein kinase
MFSCCGGPPRGDGDGRHMVGIAKEMTQTQIEQRYRIDAGELGSGNYATVKRATRRTDRLQVAMKFIDKSHPDLDAGVLATEARIMMGLDHPNCIKCYEVMETPTHVVLALELATGGDLFSVYERPGKYTEADAAINVKEMVDGLAYLHSCGIAHRDLKLENVLVGHGHVLKICDFGFAKAKTGGNTLQTCVSSLGTPSGETNDRADRSYVQCVMLTRCDFCCGRFSACGTPEYVAPEVVRSRDGAYSEKCDMWSLGVIAYIMLSGGRPYWNE